MLVGIAIWVLGVLLVLGLMSTALEQQHKEMLAVLKRIEEHLAALQTKMGRR